MKIKKYYYDYLNSKNEDFNTIETIIYVLKKDFPNVNICKKEIIKAISDNIKNSPKNGEEEIKEMISAALVYFKNENNTLIKVTQPYHLSN